MSETDQNEPMGNSTDMVPPDSEQNQPELTKQETPVKPLQEETLPEKQPSKATAKKKKAAKKQDKKDKKKDKNKKEKKHKKDKKDKKKHKKDKKDKKKKDKKKKKKKDKKK